MKTGRRTVVKGLAALGAACVLRPTVLSAQSAAPTMKTIPSTGEKIPPVGLGSWITFNVGDDPKLRDECAAVIAAFFASGGRMIDCSPMYGSSQSTIGYGLKKLGYPERLFSAEKVWTSGASGPTQIEETRAYWGVEHFDLLQVHNLMSWKQHLATLRAMKDEGRVRYVGITTSHGRRHEDVVRILSTEKLDFVQVTYNALDRDVEDRILPLAQERGVAVIANRPFRRGALIDRVKAHPLPAWVAETGASSWPQFLLKFIISHPAITCAIPATSRVDHVRENMGALDGLMPDTRMRQRMADYVRQL